MPRPVIPRRVDQPEPGLFRLRLVKGGPYVAAELAHGAEGWQAIIDGTPAGPPHANPDEAPQVWRVWHYGHPVEPHEHARLLALSAWARDHSPQHPAADPSQPIRLSQLPPVF